MPSRPLRHATGLLRFYALAPLDARGYRAPDALVMLAGLLAFAFWTFMDRWAVGPDSEFWEYGLHGVVWYGLALCTLGWVLHRASSPPPAFSSAVLALIAVTPIAVAGYGIALRHLEDDSFLAVIAGTTLLCVLYLARALRALTGRIQIVALPLALIAAALIGWAADRLGITATLWVEPEVENAHFRRTWREAERLLFEQPARIQSAVNALATSHDGAPAGYFLGFAGYGEEKVFAEEVALAARVFGERYGTGDRTLLLINDRRDLESRPLATVSGLSYALQALGRRMDRERDFLVLVLSSHGSEDAALTVSNGRMPLRDLSAGALADALRSSGIVWKIVIISACYSGSFVDALKDPHTIVLTAAAADRTSFGCSDDRDLTYFGEAFFRDALPMASSLAEAFEQARRAIAEREKAEGMEASNPVAYYGSAMLARLEAIEPGTAAGESAAAPR